jgi:hypothetical protein
MESRVRHVPGPELRRGDGQIPIPLRRDPGLPPWVVHSSMDPFDERSEADRDIGAVSHQVEILSEVSSGIRNARDRFG